MATILRAQGAAHTVTAFARVGSVATRARHAQAMLGHPGTRLPALAKLIRELKGVRPVRIMETHNGLTGLIVESASARRVDTGEKVSFDGMWSSSLTASSAQGKPDIETVDTTVSMHAYLPPGVYPCRSSTWLVVARHVMCRSWPFWIVHLGLTCQNDHTQCGTDTTVIEPLAIRMHSRDTPHRQAYNVIYCTSTLFSTRETLFHCVF